MSWRTSGKEAYAHKDFRVVCYRVAGRYTRHGRAGWCMRASTGVVCETGSGYEQWLERESEYSDQKTVQHGWWIYRNYLTLGCSRKTLISTMRYRLQKMGHLR
jgi:hypothetical protein